MFLFDYLTWHYSTAFADVFHLFKNFFLGISHKFFISGHMRTLFSPWHRAKPTDSGKLDTKERVFGFTANIYITFVAALIRLIIIGAGIFSESLVAAAFVATLVIWFLLPVLILVGLYSGITMLIA